MPYLFSWTLCFGIPPVSSAISLKALLHEWRIVPNSPTHEKRMTFNAWKTNDVDKGENNTHKQRTLPNDECPVKASNGHETQFRRISTNAKKWHSFLMRWPMRHSCDRDLNQVKVIVFLTQLDIFSSHHSWLIYSEYFQLLSLIFCLVYNNLFSVIRS